MILVSYATHQHDAGLRRLLRETPLRGGMTVTLAREPSFFVDDMETVVAVMDGRVIACGSRVLREVYWNGTVVESAYLSDLRVHPDYQKHAGRILRDGYRLLSQSAALRPAAVTWSAVFESNHTAMKALGRQRRAIPEYVDRGALRSPVLWCGPACRWPNHPGCRRAVEEDRHELAVFFQNQFAGKSLAPVVRAADLQMGDFILIREEGVIVAAVAAWDFRAIKQIRVVQLPWNLRLPRRPMNWLSPLYPFPRLPVPGDAMPLGYAGFMAVENDDVPLARTLLLAARVVAAEKGLNFLCACFHEDDPRFHGAKGLPATRADGRLFQVMLSGSSDEWTDQIPHIEAAWL